MAFRYDVNHYEWKSQQLLAACPFIPGDPVLVGDGASRARPATFVRAEIRRELNEVRADRPFPWPVLAIEAVPTLTYVVSIEGAEEAVPPSWVARRR